MYKLNNIFIFDVIKILYRKKYTNTFSLIINVFYFKCNNMYKMIINSHGPTPHLLYIYKVPPICFELHIHYFNLYDFIQYYFICQNSVIVIIAMRLDVFVSSVFVLIILLITYYQINETSIYYWIYYQWYIFNCVFKLLKRIFKDIFWGFLVH